MATRFWVGGTGNLDGSTTTHISATTGGAGGASYPGSADTLTFDASSGGGTVTVTADHTLQSMSMGAFTGTWDNSVNNKNFTLTASAGFNNSNTGVRTVKLGSGTYTLSATTAIFNMAVTTNLTFVGSSANIVFTGGAGNKTFTGGGASYGNLTIGAASGAGILTFSGANTFASMTITAPNYVLFPVGLTTTISGAFTWSGSSSSQIGIVSTSASSPATIAAAAGSTANWAAFRDMTFTGSPTASNSADLGDNTGITITTPSPSGGGAGFSGYIA